MEPLFAEPSPRTPEEPMAFTWWELTRGVIAACLVFAIAAPALALVVAVISDPAHAGFSIYLIVAGWLLGIVPTTALAGFALAPVAKRIGRALRHRRSLWPHLLSYFALGAAASLIGGAIVGLLIGATSWSGDAVMGAGFVIPLAALLAPVAGASAATGWLITARRALRDDRTTT